VTPARRPLRIRWWIFAYMFAFAMISYIQRQSVAVAADNIMPALHLSQMQIAWLNAAFTAGYAIAQLPGGLLAQRYGVRATYVGVGLIGLVGTLSTPLAPVILAGNALFLALLLTQGILGLSQGPLFPSFALVLQRWFPVNRWAIANGLQTAGMNLGGAVTPFLIVVLTDHFGWQGALLWVAVPVALVTAGWGWYGRDNPAAHRKVTPEELAELDAVHSAAPEPMTVRRLLGILGDRDVLLLSISYLAMNYSFYLISFWSFLYLVQVRHFSGLESGVVGAIPWIGAGIGAGMGGFISDWLAERLGVRWGYRLVPLVTLPLAGLLLLLTIRVDTPYAAVAALACAFWAVEITEGAYWAATMRVARADTGAATGVLNTGGNLGGVIGQPIVGALSGVGLWSGAFATGTALAFLAALLWLFVDAARHEPTDG
jgi:ACS family glucarate transporter-like MFS transporter